MACLYCAQGHDQSSTLSQHTAELTLPKHSPLHRDLLRYAKLMEWLKNTQREKYEGLSRVSHHHHHNITRAELFSWEGIHVLNTISVPNP